MHNIIKHGFDSRCHFESKIIYYVFQFWFVIYNIDKAHFHVNDMQLKL